MGMVRHFNIAGPVVPSEHYSIPPLKRLDLDYVLSLIRGREYFTLYAPRQTGKTSALLALQDLLNSGAEGPYRCVYMNVEPGQPLREDVSAAMEAILDQLSMAAESALGDASVETICNDVLALSHRGTALQRALFLWAQADPRPLVILIDEIDALVDDTLISVLRQLRAGYHLRPASFPQSIVLCGVRDLRNCRIHSKSQEPVTGGSEFNISADSLRLGDFSRADVEILLAQHTEETGQAFLPEAVERMWTQTQGQPWLVNALCHRACFRSARGRNRARPITDSDLLEAQEQLIVERVVHLDQLADKLQEDRVRRVIEPLLSGGPDGRNASPESERQQDLQYARDLGLIARDDPPRIANPIYAEVVPRELTAATQWDLPLQAISYVEANGGLDLPKLLADFQAFFRQQSEHWLQRFDYCEAGSQLLLQAFLQNVVSGGGHIEREYGRGRTDLLVVWPRDGKEQRFVIECKILRDGLEGTIRAGLAQIAGYMDKCGTKAGHLVIFDRNEGRWEDKIFHRSEKANGASVEVWGM